ncbi:mannose-6-phosphate isomerase [Phaeobacter sp. B1627]|uniref:mannose-6-phosphate isomerase n=1 Tax=Phaeobacter sp. B1627 TaxID=2583809 RepID=UPI0011185C6A|nr:mannose-6-phosphate isomerase [Phaeobacter sp. B1627]TNJ43992.1 mannose-6-phosphate isomerase [Phaeobacter sp. B1627]
MLHPIILAGSTQQSDDLTSGVRPMHFEDAPGVASRFSNLLTRLSGDIFAPAVVVAPQECAALVRQQSQPGAVTRLILEPGEHKPAAALLSAVLSLQNTPHALVVVAPASADFEDASQLDQALCQAIPAAQRGEIVMLGQRRSRDYMGYGSLEVASIPRDTNPVAVNRVMPSDRQTSLSNLLVGNHQLCGLGVYVARVDMLLAAYKFHASRVFLPVKNAFQCATVSGGALLLDNENYRRVKPQSFEKTVAQRARSVVAIQVDQAWTEYSEWDRDAALDRRQDPGVAGWHADCLEEQAAAHPHAADMIALYQSLASAQAGGAPVSSSVDFDWGRRETVAMGPGLSLKRLVVKPGEAVRLRAGPGGAEHWIVVKGDALVTLGAHIRRIWETQSARIPAGRSRRIENSGSMPLHMVQMQVASATPPAPSTPAAIGGIPAGFA